VSRENQIEQDHAVARVAEPAQRPTWPTDRSLPALSEQGVVRGATWAVERLIAVPLAFPIAIGLLSRAFSSGLLLVAPAFRQDPLPVLTAFRSPFLAWDSQWFLSIARWGYHASPLQAGGIGGHHDFAFYPGWPAVLHVFGGFGLPIAPAAVVAANLLFIAALVAIFAVLEQHFGTDAARRGTMMWQIAVEDSSTHCHQVCPPTRAEVSSEPTTALARTAAAIGAAAASSGVAARARMLAIAPSLIVTPNTSASSRARRSKPIAWVL